MIKQQSYTGPKSDVISMIRKVQTRVLDIDWSNGNLGKALKSKYNDILVSGVDNEDINIPEPEKKIDKTHFRFLPFLKICLHINMHLQLKEY